MQKDGQDAKHLQLVGEKENDRLNSLKTTNNLKLITKFSKRFGQYDHHEAI